LVQDRGGGLHTASLSLTGRDRLRDLAEPVIAFVTAGAVGESDRTYLLYILPFRSHEQRAFAEERVYRDGFPKRFLPGGHVSLMHQNDRLA